MLERVLIVGLGSIGRRHARLLRDLTPTTEIVAMRHDAPHDRDGVVDRCVSTIDEALEFRPQAAVVCNPASHHLRVAVDLARAGVHLLVEKPLSNSTNGVPELLEECRARQVTLMIGYNLRFLSSLRRLRELLIERRIGRVLSVKAEVGQFLPMWRPDCDYRNTVSARAELGGGVLLELSHEIDYLRWLFGEVEWVSAVARTQSSLELDVEDTAHLVLGFVGSAGERPVIAALSMDCIRHDATRCCTVIGQNGSLRWSVTAGTVEVFNPGGEAWECVYAHRQHRDESYVDELRHFADCISQRRDPLVTGDDGLAVLRIIEAARISSSAGTVVPLDDTSDGSKLRESVCAY